MGRDPGSEAYSTDYGSRSSSLFSCEPREDIVEEALSFESFAEAIREELAPRSRLQRVLADRVILSAWTLHETGLAEFRSIRNLSSCEPLDDPEYGNSLAAATGPAATSTRDISLVVRCLGRSID